MLFYINDIPKGMFLQEYEYGEMHAVLYKLEIPSCSNTYFISVLRIYLQIILKLLSEAAFDNLGNLIIFTLFILSALYNSFT